MSDKSSKPNNRSLFDWLGYREEWHWNKARPLGWILGNVLFVAVPGLFVGAILAAGAVLWVTVRDIGSGPSSGPNLGAGAMIAALLGAPFIIWGTYLRQRAVEFQKEGLLTDRINKAVEMLGADKTWLQYSMDEGGNPVQVERTVPNIEVRIGGLLSLERISQDSVRYDAGRDHVRVMEILCAYVRENAPVSEAKKGIHQIYEEETKNTFDTPGLEHDEFIEKYNFQNPDRLKWALSARGILAWASELPQPREDINLTLRIIGRRTKSQKNLEAQWQLTPSEQRKWPFNFDGLKLHLGVDPTLRNGKPSANYTEELIAWRDSIQRYEGFKPSLAMCNLQGARLSEGDYSGIDFSGSKLDGSEMQKSEFNGADFSSASMVGAQLQWSTLLGANLTSADLRFSDLTGSRFECVHNLLKTKFGGTFMRYTSFLESRLMSSHIAMAFGHTSVNLPDDLKTPDHWSDSHLTMRDEYIVWLRSL